jgi:hypothetical protein
MTILQPPRLATALLKRLADGPQCEALIGDVMERYQTRQSALWYWRQAVSAIFACAVNDVHDHAGLMLRAIAVWYVLAWIAGRSAMSVYQGLGLWMWNWTVAHDLDRLRVLWFGRPHWQSPPFLLMTCVNQLVIGWIIARLHRPHRAAALLTCGAVSLFYSIGVGLFIFQPRTVQLLFPVALIATPVMRISPVLFVLICVPVSFLLGGLLGSSRSEARSVA